MTVHTCWAWELRKVRGACAAGLLLAATAMPFQAAFAQNAAMPPAPVAAAAPQVTPPPAGPVIPPSPAMAGPTGSAVVNLIRILVEQGILTQDRANALIRQAEDEAAAAARAQGAAALPNVVAAPAPVPPSAETPAGAPGTPAAPPATASTSVRVPYIPEIVRRQIRDEVKAEVIQEAKNENWAQPNAIPEWTKRFQLFGDFRLRYEFDNFDERNSSFFPNFQALNAGAPFDLNNAAGTPPPLLNTTEDRQRMRFRLRLGAQALVSDDFTAGIRLATGNTTNPVTTMQSFGTDFNKYFFLVDRAFVVYQPVSFGKLWLGRFDNPFLTTDDLVWDDDLGFDGAATQVAYDLAKGYTLFASGGAFAVENTSFNFPDNSVSKQPSRDKWLFGAQVGFGFNPTHDYEFKAAVAYYDFQNIEGKLSSPCTVFSSADPCSTDDTRPIFQAQGNTMFAIRDLVSNAANPPLFQYYGLASKFHELNANLRFDFAHYDPLHVVIDADYVRNVAFSWSKINALNPVNNRGASPASGGVGPFDGGGTAYEAHILFGYPVVREWGDWNLGFAYRYMESDSVVDAFTDNDFHLGGTNAKGYIFGGMFGVGHNVNLQARWYSASEVSGPPYSVDVWLLDFNAQF
jgi:hypothetical protein